MKNLHNAIMQQVVKASITTNLNQGFYTFSLNNEKIINLKHRLLAVVLLSWFFLASGFNAFAQPTVSSVTVQNGKNATITSTICPWTNTDADFNDPITTGGDVIGIQSVTKSTETIGGVSCRKMQTVIKKKTAGLAQVFISVGNAATGFLYVGAIDFKLYNDLFSMSVPGHINDGGFITNGFHPGQVVNMALKVIDTQTGNYHPGTNGYAMVNILGSGFTFNGGAMAQTVMFNNGMANIMLQALNPNSNNCYFRISDDSLPGSISGSAILHTAMISLTPPPIALTSATSNATCGSVNNGSATMSVTGGTTPYLYSCSNGVINSLNPNFTGLAPGTYTATVTDFYGTTATKSFSISQNVLSIQGAVTMPFCDGNTGSIDISVTGSSSPLNYMWNDGVTTEDRSNLLPGIYNVNVFGSPGCNASATFDLSQPNTAPEIICIPDMAVSMLPGKNYAIADFNISAIDECQMTMIIVCKPASGSAFYKGITNVTCTATDAMGLSSTCNFNVIVNDEEAPVADISDKTIALASNGTKTLTPAMLSDSSTDNSGIMSKVIAPNILSCSSIGTISVTMTVTDGNNHYWSIDNNGVKYYNNNNILISTHTTVGKVSVIVTSDGGFIVIDDGRVRKYDKNGNLQSTIFTTGEVKVITTSDGGFIVIDDGRVRKYDKDGNLQSTIFTTGAVTVIQTADGGFIVIDDGRVRKYDKDGNLQSTIFTTGNVQVIKTPCDSGFIVVDEGRVRKYDKNGNLQSTIFTTGAVKIILTEPCGFIVIDDGRVRKYDDNGNLQSTIFTTGDVKVITTSDGGFIVIDDGRVRKYDSNGNLQSTIFTTGQVQVITMGDCGFIVIDDGRVRKYDKDGNLQSTIFTTGAVKVILTADCGFIVIDDGRVRKYDGNGNLQSTIFTTGEVKVITTSDGGFIVIDDGRVRKYDSNGNLQSTIFTTGNVQVITMGDCGFIVIDDGRVRKYDKDGNLQSTIFTTGAVKVILTADCGFIVIDDGRVRKYDGNGNLQSTIFTTGEVTVITTSDGGFIVIDDGRVRKYDKDGNLQSTIFTTGGVKVITDANGGFKVIDDGRIRVYDKDGNLMNTIFTIGTSYPSAYTNNSLSSTDTAAVTVPNPITLSATVLNVSCAGKKTGKITLTVSAVTGPYTYLWSNGKTSKNLSALAAGTYTGAVTDKNGCTNSITCVVAQPGALIVNVTKTTIKCGGASTGKATAVASGGTAPYTYSWNTVPVQTSAMATGLAAGVYAVTVNDANGCTKTKSVNIIQNAPLVITIVQANDSAKAEVSGGVGPYTYKWSTTPVQTAATATGLICNVSYSVTVTDSKGCKKTSIFIHLCRLLGESITDSKDVISVYPNPTAGQVSVDVSNIENEIYNIEVLDAIGKVVYAANEIHPDNNKFDLDLSTLANGIYSLRIIAGNEIKMAKVVIEK